MGKATVVRSGAVVLVSLVAAAASPSDGGKTAPGKGAARPFFVHISDTHIAKDPGAIVYKQVPNANAARAVAMIGSLSPAPREVIVTGDLACNKGSEEEYRQYQGVLAPLTMTVRHLMGNHDDYAAFWKVVLKGKNEQDPVPPGGSPSAGYRYKQAWDWDKDWRFLSISTLNPGVTSGEVGKAQMDWLEQEAMAAKDRNVALFMHHHPLRSDKPGIADADAMKAALQRHPNIRAVFFGHMHILSLAQDGPLHLICAPSCSYGHVPGNVNALGFLLVTPEPAAFTVKFVTLDDKQAEKEFERRLSW